MVVEYLNANPNEKAALTKKAFMHTERRKKKRRIPLQQADPQQPLPALKSKLVLNSQCKEEGKDHKIPTFDVINVKFLQVRKCVELGFS